MYCTADKTIGFLFIFNFLAFPLHPAIHPKPTYPHLHSPVPTCVTVCLFYMYVMLVLLSDETVTWRHWLDKNFTVAARAADYDC